MFDYVITSVLFSAILDVSDFIDMYRKILRNFSAKCKHPDIVEVFGKEEINGNHICSMCCIYHGNSIRKWTYY